jgi:hypothetical protein
MELDDVCHRIVVVVRLEAQTELGDARAVDDGIGNRLERGHIPAAGLWIVRDQPYARLICRSLEVCGLQRTEIAKGAFADVDRDLAMRGEGIGTNQALPFDPEHDFGNHCVIRQRGGVEVQDGVTILWIDALWPGSGGACGGPNPKNKNKFFK